ncbi:MAG: hypothetical protein AB1Z67_07560 [Candidatus Limnocylindrales bacterium]
MRTIALTTLLVATLAVPASSQEVALPSPSSEAGAAAPVEELGGTWRRMAAAPFGAVEVPGGWTGTELVLADPIGKRRAASYLPALDRWSAVARPPRKLLAGSETHWTGTELLFVEPRGTARRGLTLYDPVADEWRTTAPAPFNEIADSAWAAGALVVASAAGALAAYDRESDAWAELPPLPAARLRSLHSTGEVVLAMVHPDEGAELAFVSLDGEAGTWGEPVVGPLTAGSAPPLWIGDAFVSIAVPPELQPSEAASSVPGEVVEPGAEPSPPSTEPVLAVGASFHPASDAWTAIDDGCGIDTGGAVWADPLILDVDRQLGVDPRTGQCFTLPGSPWPEREGAFRVWTGNEVLEVSGDAGGARPRRDGVAYDPYPGGDSLGVALDKGSRPVRVTIPSLGIDLPVVWDGRKVPGSSPGYPACDVALSWSAFDLPGEPGTAWILAHAQPGMFLPLLETLDSKGKAALLGREVQVQLRDGRVLTYRTFRANPRATNTNIGSRGRKADEHRLVLQTSTGIGSAPKLLVAARLVDVATTDEPRPKPRPRACG